MFGGDGGIRTRGCLHNTRFPSVLLRPLGHVTKEQPVHPIRSAERDVTERCGDAQHAILS